MSVKDKLNSAKLWQSITGALITAVASYFGYVQVSENKTPAVDVTVEVPAQTQHSHPEYTRQDWADAIERADKRAIDKHKDSYH